MPASQAPATISRLLAAVGIVLVIGVAAGLMFPTTTFLFAFSGGQYRMVTIVNYAVLAVVGAALLVAAATWRLQSPVAALKWATIVTRLGWVAAVLAEWLLSFQFGSVSGP